MKKVPSSVRAHGHDLGQFAKRQNDLNHLVARRERLNPELAHYLIESPSGLMLNHPLVQHLGVDPDRAGIVNWRYQEMLKVRSEAVAKGEWSKFVHLHVRPYRLGAFMEIADCLSNKNFWVLLADVWTDSENIWEDLEDWRVLWNTEQPGKHFAMDAKERRAFKQLPNEITIYRGISEGHTTKGMSWTLDRGKAIWFAKRYEGWHEQRPVLLTACANKSEVHALLLGREENEIVVDRFMIAATEYVI
jgi:hypothetical protein